MKRYPLQNLIDAVGLPPGVSDSEIARRLQMDRTTLARARDRGFLGRFADLYAVRSGFVPWLVWPEWLDDEIEAASIVCANDRCGESFVPSRKGHRFCSVRCGRRVWDRAVYRRKYEADPGFAAAERERARAYREAAGRAIRLREKAYREATREERRAYMRAYYQANREELLEKQRQRDRRAREAA